MAQSTTNLNLTVWNSLTDPYDSSQLVDNFVKIDSHNHTGGKGVAIPFAGIDTAAIATSGTSSSTKLVRADDSRLSDGRPPDYTDFAWSATGSNPAYSGTFTATTKSSIVRQSGSFTGTATIALPPASQLPAGSEIIVQGGGSVTSANTISVAPAGSDTINGSGSSVVIGAAYGFRRFITDGTSAWVYDAGVVRLSTTDLLINKSLSDSTTYIVDATDNTKKLNIDVTGTTGITGVLQTAFTTAKTIAFPDTAGTVVTTGDSATVSTTMLSTTGVSAGTYSNVTVDTKGRVSAGTKIDYGSTLPGSPADGDEYYYLTNGNVWHLRYTTLAGLNKWQFVGGTALTASQNTGSALTATTYTYNGALMASPYGPSLTVPTGMTGTYKVEFGMDVSNTNAGKVNYMGLFTSATGNTSPLGSNTELIVANADNNTGANPATYTASKIVHNVSLTATSVIYAQFKTSANTATVSNRYISITPVTIG